MTIKHIVISGGGPTGLLSYGAAKYLEQQQFWSMENIESIYGTSIGALFGVILSLHHDWKTIDDYIIKCPWNEILKKTQHFMMCLMFTQIKESCRAIFLILL